MKNFLPMIALAAILMTPLVAAYGTGTGSSSEPILGSVNINPITCGISAFAVDNPLSGLNYGSTNPGVTAMASTPIQINNNGNTPTTSVTVTAGDWTGVDTVGNIMEHIKAENTAFTLDATLTPGTFHPLSPTSVVQGSTMPGTTLVTNAIPGVSSLNTYWRRTANLDNTPFSGQLTQTMTFTSGC